MTCLTSICPCGLACGPSASSYLDTSGPIQFGSVDVPLIEENFFFAGSNGFLGPIEFVGGNHGGILSSPIVIQRGGPIVCPFAGFPRSCDPVSIEIVSLNLVSAAPITVSPDGSQWQVTLELSAFPPSPIIPGQLDPTLDHANGGKFSASLHVLPKFTFTKVSGGSIAASCPSEVKILDYGELGLPQIEINFTDVPWVINLASGLAETITPTGDGDLVLGVEELTPGDPLSQAIVPISVVSKEGGFQWTSAPAPPPETQACCIGNGTCEDLVLVDCSFFDGDPQGSGSTCSTTACPILGEPIPAATQWGVLAMLLMILCTGTILAGRRRAAG